MSDMYRAFLRRFQAETLGQGMSVKQVARSCVFILRLFTAGSG